MEEDEEDIISRGVAKWNEALNEIAGTPTYAGRVHVGHGLAHGCRHEPGCEEAEWFCSLGDTAEASRYFFLHSLREHDDAEGRSRFFREVLAISVGWPRVLPAGEDSQMRKSFKMGYPAAVARAAYKASGRKISSHSFATTVSTIFVGDEEKNADALELARQASHHGNVLGMFLCAVLDQKLSDKERTSALIQAAKLGSIEARKQLWKTLPLSSLFKWTCGFKNAQIDIDRHDFVLRVRDLLASTHGKNRGRVIYHVGRLLESEFALPGIMTGFARELMSLPVFENYRTRTKHACGGLIAFYNDNKFAAIDGVCAWSLVARHLRSLYRLPRDMRIMIAKYVWAQRFTWFDWDEWRMRASLPLTTRPTKKVCK
jgi:hypothetical protein